ncbi:hypothetical protein AMTRI_Chr08g206210 [Amborella trichopoda]
MVNIYRGKPTLFPIYDNCLQEPPKVPINAGHPTSQPFSSSHLDPCPVLASQSLSFQSPLNEVANPFSQTTPLPPSTPLVQTPATSLTVLAENLPIQTLNLLLLHPYYSSSPLVTSTSHPSFESLPNSNGDIQYPPSFPLTLVPYFLFLQPLSLLLPTSSLLALPIENHTLPPPSEPHHEPSIFNMPRDQKKKPAYPGWVLSANLTKTTKYHAHLSASRS